MDPQTKNMALGAVASFGADAILQTIFLLDPIGRGDTFPFQSPHPIIPAYDDWIAGAGVPLLLYGLGKGTRRQGLVDMSKGAAFYGVPMLALNTLTRAIIHARAPGKPIHQASWLDMPKVTETKHSGEKLPFQTNIDY